MPMYVDEMERHVEGGETRKKLTKLAEKKRQVLTVYVVLKISVYRWRCSRNCNLGKVV